RLWVEAGINIDVWGYAECDLCEARGGMGTISCCGG
ncbi:hypothetical protein EC960109_3069, partial [Escherichia coli 96.0109]